MFDRISEKSTEDFTVRAGLHTRHHNGYVDGVQQMLIWVLPLNGGMTTLVHTTSAWQSVRRRAATSLTLFDIIHQQYYEKV